MKPLMMLLLSLGLAISTGHSQTDLRLYDLGNGALLTGPQAIETVAAVRMIMVGEQHTDPAHHAAQLALIQALHDTGRDIAIGLEMFRNDRQKVLDQWVKGTLSEEAFKRVYSEDWNYPWDLYRPILEYARQKGIPMVGLNVPRDITRQVARYGFQTLSPQQKKLLGDVTCDVTPAYRDFVARAHSAHDHGGLNFENFCEAQMVWDTAMAVHALRFVEQHPTRTLVILAGSGHARHAGIPTQVLQRSELPLLVILPHTPGRFEPAILSTQEADYLLMQ